MGKKFEKCTTLILIILDIVLIIIKVKEILPEINIDVLNFTQFVFLQEIIEKILNIQIIIS